MKTILSRSRRIALTAASGILTIGLAACQTDPRSMKLKDDHLVAAGFVQKAADTPTRQEMLKHLPPHHFVRHETSGKVTYLFADPVACGCLYVGDQKAYDAYRSYQQQQQLIEQKRLSAETMSDPAWDWDAWGGVGPGYGPGFGTTVGPAYGKVW
ncbi:hypothetical protein [Acetobacter musti]|uniref:hypothetical protein n=1 Tax=Acetobacter musti TaxID=864732 RepID=UPI0030CDAB47